MPTDQSRTGRLLRNGLYSLLSWALPLILALLVTPMIVKGLGHEAYGLYAVILGFIGYSFAFGIGKAATKYVSEFRAAGNADRISGLVSSLVWISLGFGISAIVVIGLAAPWLVRNVLLISPELQETAIAGLYLGSITILLTVVSQVFQSVLQGVHRFDRFLLLGNISALLLNFGSVLLVWNGFGVTHLVLWNSVVVFFVGVMFYANARRLLPEFRLTWRVARQEWNAAWGYSLSIVGYQIFGNALLLFERGWVVRRFGADSLTYYVVPMTLCLYFHAFVSSLALVLFPLVNELLSEPEKLLRLYRTATKVVLALTAFFAVTAIVGGRGFLSVWIGNDFSAAAYPIFVAHVVTFGVLAITIVAWQTVESFRAAFLNVLVTGSWLIVSVPLMIILADTLEEAGVAWARAIGVVTFLPLIVFVESRFLGGFVAGFWISTLLRLAFVVTICGASEMLVLSSLRLDWVTFGLASSVGAVTFAAGLVVTGYFDAVERGVATGLLRGHYGTGRRGF